MAVYSSWCIDAVCLFLVTYICCGWFAFLCSYAWLSCLVSLWRRVFGGEGKSVGLNVFLMNYISYLPCALDVSDNYCLIYSAKVSNSTLVMLSAFSHGRLQNGIVRRQCLFFWFVFVVRVMLFMQ
jgi:hypothetical protein